MSFRAGGSLYLVDCDVAHVSGADLATVDALARAYVNARRLGTRVRFVNASPALAELLALVGLDGLLLGRVEREAEEREEAVRVEERVEADDPPA